jgi:hypothetical protein
MKRFNDLRHEVQRLSIPSSRPTADQIESLIKFAQEILSDFPDLSSLDGVDIQDLAEKYGLLIPEIVHASCGEGCNCAEVCDDDDFKEGVTCFHFADWLQK